jgi:hypothetical protein
MNLNIPDDVKIETVAGVIDIYSGIFTKEISKKIIELFESADSNPLCPLSYSDARVGLNDHGGSIRSNLVMGIEEHNDKNGDECNCSLNEIILFIREKLSTFVRYYSSKYDIDIAFDEGLQVLKYSPGKQYKPHTDYGPGAEHRVLSGLIYMNPGEYLGGGTHFVNFDYTIDPKEPALALFPSNYAYQHSARPVFDGYKYAIVTWFGPPWAVNKR